MNEGWKCPVCGKGVAPHKGTCDHGGPLGALPAIPLPYSPATTLPYIPARPETTWAGASFQNGPEKWGH